MSIINEALKKTQKYLERKVESQPAITPPNMASPKIDSPKKENTSVKITIILISLGFVGCVVAFFLMMFPAQKMAPTPSIVKTDLQQNTAVSNPPAAYTPPISPALPAQTIPASATASSSTNTSQLVLNGTIDTGDDQLALINNQIYRVGDDVEGRRILRIGTDKVEISENGNVVVLTTK